MGEAAAEPAGSPPGWRLGTGRRPGMPCAATARAGRLLRAAEGVAYWLAVAPLIARLPARLAYGIACWRGDWNFRYAAGKRSEIVHHLCRVLGEELRPDEAENLAREVFRMISCEAIDVMRLRGQARSLARLVEIRGSEHLDAALAAGKGAILCTAHFGSYNSAFSLLHASGFPLTTIGRWRSNTPRLSPGERRFWHLVYDRRLLRHRQRPNIEPLPGRVQIAAQAAAALRANEVVTICSDATPEGGDCARAVDVAFLGRRTKLLPGVVTLGRLTGAPVLMGFMHRAADYRHQVLEISEPVLLQGGTSTAFGRCVAAMDAVIRASPAQWFYWFCGDAALPEASPGPLRGARPTEGAFRTSVANESLLETVRFFVGGAVTIPASFLAFRYARRRTGQVYLVHPSRR